MVQVRAIGTSSVGLGGGEFGPGFRKLSNLCKGLGRRASGGFPGEPFLAVETSPRSGRRRDDLRIGSPESSSARSGWQRGVLLPMRRERRAGDGYGNHPDAEARGTHRRVSYPLRTATSSGSPRPLVCRKRPRVQGRRRVECPSSSFFLRRLRRDDLVPRSGRWVLTSPCWRIWRKNKVSVSFGVYKGDRSSSLSLDPWPSYTSDCCSQRPPRDRLQPFYRDRFDLRVRDPNSEIL